MPAATAPTATSEEHVPQAGVAAEQRHRIGADGVEQRLPERHEAGAPQDHQPEHDQRIGEGDGGERDQPGRQRRRRGGDATANASAPNSVARVHMSDLPRLRPG